MVDRAHPRLRRLIRTRRGTSHGLPQALRSLRDWRRSNPSRRVPPRIRHRRRAVRHDSAVFVIPEAASWRFGRVAERLAASGWRVTALVHTSEAPYVEAMRRLDGTSQGLPPTVDVQIRDLSEPNAGGAPYDIAFISKIMAGFPDSRPRFHASRGTRTFYVPYALFVDRAPHAQYAKPEHFWISDFAVPTSMHLRDARRVRPFTRELFVAGWPTLDDARDRRVLHASTSAHGPSTRGRRVLWAPHWTVDASAGHFGSTEKFGGLFQRLLREGWDVIMRPHPRLLRRWESGALPGRLLAVFEDFETAGRISRGPFLPDLLACTILATDSYSFMPEFAFFGKQVTFLLRDANRTPAWNEFGQHYFRTSTAIASVESMLSKLLDDAGATAGGRGARVPAPHPPFEWQIPEFTTAVLDRLSGA